MSVLGRLAARMGRYAAIFGAGSATSVVFALILVAFLTRHLSPSEYGQLAVYLLVPAFLMVLANMGSLQGTMAAVFGHTGDEGVEIVDASEARPIGDPRRVLGTGVTLTLFVGSLLALAVWLLAGPISSALGDRPDGVTLVRIGAVSGAVGAVWRLLSNFLRYSRRPVAYVITDLTRPAFALAFTVPLVLAGHGLKGAVLGFGLGTGAALLVTLAWVARDIRLGFNFRSAVGIYRYGGALVPVGLSFWTIQGADVYAVSLVGGPADAGIYRLASALSRTASYLVAAFTQSLPAIFGSPLQVAVEREEGRKATGAATLAGYSMIGAWAVLALGALADQFVRIAPTTFGSAAPLIPILALIPIGRGWFVAVYVSTLRPDRRAWFVALAAAAAPLWLLGIFLLVPPFGGYGAGVAGAVAFLVPAGTLLWVGQHSAQPLDVPWRRIVMGPILAAGLLVAQRFVAGRVGTGVQIATAVAVIALYPLLLFATRTIPAAPIRDIARQLLISGGPMRRRKDLAGHLGALPPDDVWLLQQVVRMRRGISDVAVEAGAPSAVISTRLHSSLRQVAGVEPERRTDEAVVEWLFFTGGASQREQLARALVEGGNDPLALDQLEVKTAAIRRLPRRMWPPGTTTP